MTQPMCSPNIAWADEDGCVGWRVPMRAQDAVHPLIASPAVGSCGGDVALKSAGGGNCLQKKLIKL